MNKQEIKEQLKDLWEDIRIWWYVPKYCRCCEVAAQCRTGKNYSCGRRGCILLWQKERDERRMKEG